MSTQQIFPPSARRFSLQRALRALSLLQCVALALGAMRLHQGGMGWSSSVALVLGLWLSLIFSIAALGFVAKWLFGDWPATTRGPLLRWLRTALVEIGWMLRLYLVDMPWRAPPGRWDAPPGRTPLLLVHGFLCNASVWWPLARYLDGDCRNYAALSLQPSYRSFQQQLEDLHAAVRALVEHSGNRPVLLLGHSMGGLLVRAYAERHPESCAGVICVAAPHHGTALGDLIHGIEGGPPSPRAGWLQQFNRRSGEGMVVPALNLWSADDNIVVPARSCQLQATPEQALHGHGHMALIASASAAAVILAALDRLESTQGPSA